jgi:cytochrome P460
MRRRAMMAAGAVLVLSVGCSHRTPVERDLLNVDAALPAGLPVEPLEWRVITSSIDREHHTMATLFGNGTAVSSARLETGTVTYPTGSTLALVTWVQKDDGHWFGARIPQRFVSMELVTVAAGADGKSAAKYERFGASGQPASGSDQDGAREEAILAERASVMP